jgi:ParB-like chromosome segregation protein Spo0J
MEHKKRMRLVSVWAINVLPQMRQSFDRHELEELAGSIAEKGILNSPIVALFGREELTEYLEIINKLWNSSLRVEALKPCRIKGELRWYVLLASERRIRSYRPLVRRGVKRRLLQAVIHEHLRPFDAVDIQFSENSHRRVPPHEEAHAYAQYWALIETQGHPPSLASFSKRVGRSPSAVKAALRFVSLPAIIRNAVAGRWGSDLPHAKLLRKEKLKLAYGIAVELARLAEGGISHEELVRRMVEAVVAGTKVEQFRERGSALLGNKHQGILALMSAAQEADERRMFRRRTVEAGVSRVLVGQEVWFAKVLMLLEVGLLGREDSPFSIQSVRQRLIRVAELYEQAFPFVYRKPSEEARRRFDIVRKVRRRAEELEALLPFS